MIFYTTDGKGESDFPESTAARDGLFMMKNIVGPEYIGPIQRDILSVLHQAMGIKPETGAEAEEPFHDQCERMMRDIFFAKPFLRGPLDSSNTKIAEYSSDEFASRYPRCP